MLWLLVCDVSAGRLFRPPIDPNAKASTLQRYFEYGRSIEGKLRRSVGVDDRHSEQVTRVGWLANPIQTPQPDRPTPGHILVASYGQSFTEHIVTDAAQLDPQLELRKLGGPAAPLSHSFKLYQSDRERHQAKVVVIGVLASTLPQLTTMTTMTWGFEHAQPYTYPRYELEGKRLEEIDPSIVSLEQLRVALASPPRLRAFRAELEAHDEAFDPLIFDSDLFDYSTLGRCVRRSLGQRHQRRFTARFHDSHGFNNAEGVLDVAEALLVEFAESARRDGRIPFVLLFNDRGYGDHLYAALGPRLRARGVTFLSSHESAPPGDALSFIPDGHFRPDLERRMAAAWLEQLHDALR